jgi:hypothetical protein
MCTPTTQQIINFITENRVIDDGRGKIILGTYVGADGVARCLYPDGIKLLGQVTSPGVISHGRDEFPKFFRAENVVTSDV